MQWFLPEGIEDLLPGPAARMERYRRDLLDLFASWGYQLVVPPLVEHLDSLLTGAGADLAGQTFQVSDPLSGKMLGIRADITPQIARLDARRPVTGPARYCYLGSVLRAQANAPGAARDVLQLGAELFGCEGVAGDIELMRLMLTMLERLSIGPVTLDVGHVGVFQGVCEAIGITDSGDVEVLGDVLQRKAGHELATLTDAWGLPTQSTTWLQALLRAHGDEDALRQAERDLADLGERVTGALRDVAQAMASVGEWFPGVARYVDLGELHGYRYHTGLLYAAYCPGAGQAIAGGGRYDGVGTRFGRDRAATGFSADLKALIRLGNGHAGTEPGARGQRPIIAPAVADSRLSEMVQALRREGRVVCYALGEGQELTADTPRLVLDNDNWVLREA